MSCNLKVRKWNDDYVQYGFTRVIKDGIDRPKCVLCLVTFANSNLKPSKLREHFDSKHGGNLKSGNDFESLKQKRARFDVSGTLPKLGFCSSDKPLLLASLKVAYEVAKTKKPHTIAESLIKPCMLETARIILGHDAANKLQQVPLSNNIIRNRIVDISGDILDQIITDIKNSPLKVSLQLDESTDVECCAQLIVFVRYIKGKAIEEDFLFCKPLTTTTTAKDIFNLIKSFFSDNQIPLNVVGSICTDGAPAMLGSRSGLVALLKNDVPGVISTHCILHRQALMSKTLPVTLKNVMNYVVKIVNFIRGRALNHRLFKAFCSELDENASVLLFHTEVRWLSRGKVLSRFFQLRSEISQFLLQQKCDLVCIFHVPYFDVLLAYLVDIFTHLNDLSCSIQGRVINMITACDRLRAFKNKLLLWIARIKKDNYANFPSLDEIYTEKRTKPTENVMLEICFHLEKLKESFDGYFTPGDLDECDKWIVNPFSFQLENMEDDDNDKECLIELQSCQAMKLIYESSSLESFWCSALNSFSSLAKRALKIFIPFVTTWLCESGFSSLLYIKNKYRNTLDPENDLRICLSQKKPRYDVIIDAKRQQKSKGT